MKSPEREMKWFPVRVHMFRESDTGRGYYMDFGTVFEKIYLDLSEYVEIWHTASELNTISVGLIDVELKFNPTMILDNLDGPKTTTNYDAEENRLDIIMSGCKNLTGIESLTSIYTDESVYIESITLEETNNGYMNMDVGVTLHIYLKTGTQYLIERQGDTEYVIGRIAFR